MRGGGGVLSNTDHLLVLREESHDGKKNQYDANEATLKGLVGDLLGIDRHLILQAKNTGSWMSIRNTMVSGTLL